MSVIAKNPIVFCLYKPHAGKESGLLAIVQEHVPTLQQLGLATARPATVMRATDGAILETAATSKATKF